MWLRLSPRRGGGGHHRALPPERVMGTPGPARRGPLSRAAGAEEALLVSHQAPPEEVAFPLGPLQETRLSRKTRTTAGSRAPGGGDM